jgi:hypothetical protein
LYYFIQGGGVTYVSDFHSDEMRVFRGGLRHIPAKSDSLIYGTKNSMHNFHDKLTYERVINFI